MFKIGNTVIANARTLTDVALENKRLRQETQHLRTKVQQLETEQAHDKSFDLWCAHSLSILKDYHEQIFKILVEAHDNPEKSKKEAYRKILKITMHTYSLLNQQPRAVSEPVTMRYNSHCHDVQG